MRQGETGGDTEGETEGRQHETRERQRKRERWRETEEENRVIMDITIIKGLLFTNPLKTFVSATSFCIFTHTTVHYIHTVHGQQIKIKSIKFILRRVHEDGTSNIGMNDG